MTGGWRNPDWKYTPAAETAKPGYLERRFEEIRKQQEKEKTREDSNERLPDATTS